MAVTIKVPYGSGEVTCEIPDERPVNVVRASAPDVPGEAEADIVRGALDRPVGSPRLRELALGKRKVVILTSDHTRPVPSHITLPPMLGEIRASVPDADITILIGVGSHRSTTREEMARKFGPDFAARERIVNHDPLDASNLVSLGRLPSDRKSVV
jgi:nickel-dependent lactate racemase